MRINTDDATDDQMAELTAECLNWLSQAGREGALKIALHAPDDLTQWEEAQAWITDLTDGKV